MYKLRPVNTFPVRLMFASLILIAGQSSAWAFSDCDKALSYFWKGKYASKKVYAYRFYHEAIRLCPGFIRPYELLGNMYRKEGETELAIDFFTKAAELGTQNYKLYFLLASLLFEKGDLNEAARHLDTSLRIRADYPQALGLRNKIDKALDRDGPKIFLFEPETRRGIEIVCRSETITVRGIATDKSGVGWIRINRDNVSIDAYGNFLKEVPIQLGDNALHIEAADVIGNSSSLLIKVEREKVFASPIRKTGPSYQTDTFYGNSFAVVIGINNYEKWPALECAINDAKAVQHKLQAAGFGEITTLFDQEATQRRVLTELFDILPRKVKRNDRVIFYYAGHGQTEALKNGGKKGYIIPVDADTANYAASAISMEQVRSLSSRIPAKHILFVMDSCYSGLGLNRSYGLSQHFGGYIHKVASARAVQIVTAGGMGEQVQERGGHGLFTTYFLKALAGEADINTDGVITGTELGAYLRPKVSDASQQTQTPLFGRLEGEGEFLFFYHEQRSKTDYRFGQPYRCYRESWVSKKN